MLREGNTFGLSEVPHFSEPYQAERGAIGILRGP